MNRSEGRREIAKAVTDYAMPYFRNLFRSVLKSMPKVRAARVLLPPCSDKIRRIWAFSTSSTERGVASG